MQILTAPESFKASPSFKDAAGALAEVTATLAHSISAFLRTALLFPRIRSVSHPLPKLLTLVAGKPLGFHRLALIRVASRWWHWPLRDMPTPWWRPAVVVGG